MNVGALSWTGREGTLTQSCKVGTPTGLEQLSVQADPWLSRPGVVGARLHDEELSSLCLTASRCAVRFFFFSNHLVEVFV